MAGIAIARLLCYTARSRRPFDGAAETGNYNYLVYKYWIRRNSNKHTHLLIECRHPLMSADTKWYKNLFLVIGSRRIYSSEASQSREVDLINCICDSEILVSIFTSNVARPFRASTSSPSIVTTLYICVYSRWLCVQLCIFLLFDAVKPILECSCWDSGAMHTNMAANINSNIVYSQTFY